MKKMLWTLLGMFIVLAIPACGGNSTPTPTPTAEATLVDPQGNEVGKATLEETDKGVKINLTVKNLPPGEHAFHIHEQALCDAPDFTTAGGHYNPFGKKHGLKNPEGPHAGDLPNITIGSDGRGSFEIMAPLVTLKSGEKNSLFHPGGTSLMIHQDPDDHVSDPAGHAGPRIACGPIVKKSP
jgi:superoxide dismutase, Cu-Zn family